jgi:Uma2 family endonuclease
MAEVLDEIELSPTVLHTGPEWQMSDDQLYDLCRRNKELRIERDSEGDLFIMSPEGGTSGFGNVELIVQFHLWAHEEGSGRAFGSSTGFILPNNAMRSPDVAWVRKTRLKTLAPGQLERFIPLCPDFVLELRSPSDRLKTLQDKMDEYIANGAELGWLLNPPRKEVHIYRPGAKPDILVDPKTVSGDPTLRGFVLNVPQIWAAMNSID